jgi:hypothetical protein
MSNSNIYYINIKPYVYDLSFETIITRFLNSSISKEYDIINKNEFKEYMVSFMNNYQYFYVKKKPEEYNIDKLLSDKILLHLHIFFDKTPTSNTRKNNYKKIKDKTRKKR